MTDTLPAIRRLVMATLLLGLLGIGIELILLEHTEGFWQRVPLVLILIGFVVLGWHAGWRSAASLRVLQGTMILFLGSGLAGLFLHYRGNVEFELEMYPARAGLELFWESLKGATPALSPGTMLVLGLLGLTYTYHHPGLTGPAQDLQRRLK